jgi:hypothetical protein
MSGTIGITAQDVYTIDTATMANISAAGNGLGNITISNSTGSSYYYNTPATMTINSSGSIGIGTTTIGSINPSTFKWNNEEFVDTLPDISRIQKMCEQYPGFKIAFEKFKTTYYLIKDDYDTPEDKRPKP